MDEPHADPALVRKSLAFIRRINRLFGYNRATISHLERFSRNWRGGARITLLDIATGSGDVPRAILKWAEKRGHRIRVTGLDRHPVMSRVIASEAQLQSVRGDALRLPFADGSFDYVINSMFLHHLSQDEAVTVLREMNRVARRGILIADLVRDSWAYRWISLFSLFANPMVRHDARVSVAQAFVESEILELRDRAGVGYADYFRHAAHRFVLAGEKSSAFR